MNKQRKKYKHLCEKERFLIEKLLNKSVSIRGIALVLDRSPNTISRELKRCKEGYNANKANKHRYYKQYWKKKDCMKVAMDSFLIRFTEEKLKKKWSPKQISGYLCNLGIKVSPKAIYKFTYNRGLDYLLFDSWNKRKPDQKRYRYNQDKDDRKYIDERPKIDKMGHYEMDFVVSKRSKWVLLVVTEILIKITYVRKLSNIKHATVNRVLSSTLSGKTVHSITTHNAIAFRAWKEIEKVLNTSIYFTHPYSSWEKRLVENTNRWIRCFVHKKRDIGTVTSKEIQEIHSFLNDRPREVLGFQIPSVLYYRLSESVLLRG